MRYPPLKFLILFSAVSASTASASQTDIPEFSKSKKVNGELYHFKKVIQADGGVLEEVKNSKHQVLASPDVQKLYTGTNPRPKVASEVLDKLENHQYGPIEIVVSFESVDSVSMASPRQGSYSPERGWVINGKPQSKQDQKNELQERLAQRKSERDHRAFVTKARMTAWARRHGLDIGEKIEAAADSDVRSMTLRVSRAELDQIVESADRDKNVVSIDLYHGGGPAIADAMLYSHVDPRALGSSNYLGDNIGVFVTEWTGCAAAMDYSNYEVLDGGVHWHGEYVLEVVRNVSPNSYMYCTGEPRLPTSSELSGSVSGPPVHIVNASFAWGAGDNSYTTSDRDWDDYVYNNYVSIFAAAGNNGTSDGRVTPPSRGFNVSSVGSSNDATGDVSEFSNYIDPKTGAEKPDFTAPGEDQCLRGTCGLSGTSLAAPHAAGMAANYAGQFSGARDAPFLLRSLMIATATNAETGNSNGGDDSEGVGGLSFLNDRNSAYAYFWYVDAANSHYSSSSNPNWTGTDNEVEFQVTAGEQVNAAIAWSNRGSYTYAHRNDVHPIGQDYDLTVVDPNGKIVGSSSSWDNSFELVRFDATVSGTYKFKIKRHANRDTGARYQVGLTLFRKVN